MTSKVDWRLYVITDRRAAGGRPLTEIVRAAVAGGATVVQLREKTATTREMIELGQALHAITQEAGIPLIVNDRGDVALAIGAEGVHVGQEDMPAPLARRLIGPDRILGVSAGTVDEARQAEADGADYIGAGDVFGTPSKPDAGAPIGVEGLAEITGAISIPVVGIGGIMAGNAAQVIRAGAAGVAVISAVVGAENPEAAARQMQSVIPINEVHHQIAKALSRIRDEKPLIHQITNLVVMNDVANVTLHVGALPVMAHAAEEVAEMTRLAGALVLNLGTLTPDRVEAMLIAGQRANELGIPIVLDPVGVGATTFRVETAWRLLDELEIAVVRGNAGEVGALSGAGGVVKGVESVEGASNPAMVAQNMARERGMVIAITGERDVVSDGERTLGVDNGHAWLKTNTGTGCMSTTVVAAFAAVERDYLLAAAGGLACFGLAAELAAKNATGPASFKVALFDHLYHLTPEQLTKGARITDIGPVSEGA